MFLYQFAFHEVDMMKENHAPTELLHATGLYQCKWWAVNYMGQCGTVTRGPSHLLFCTCKVKLFF